MQALLTRGNGAFQAAQLTIRAEQSPLAESRVSLGSDVDALGMPRAVLDWRIAPEDNVQLRRALVLLGRELGASGIARAWLPGDSSQIRWRPSPGGHHLGTTRMGWILRRAWSMAIAGRIRWRTCTSLDLRCSQREGRPTRP